MPPSHRALCSPPLGTEAHLVLPLRPSSPLTQGRSLDSVHRHPLLQLKAHLPADVRRRAADVGGKASGLGLPCVGGLAPVLQHVGGDGEGHLTGLAGGEGYLLESLQLLHGAQQGRLVVTDVELHHFLAGILTGILHLCGYKDKAPKEEKQMRAKENYYLAAWRTKE